MHFFFLDVLCSNWCSTNTEAEAFVGSLCPEGSRPSARLGKLLINEGGTCFCRVLN